MRRQAVRGRVAFVFTLIAVARVVVGCALDKQGTEFTALAQEAGFDGSLPPVAHDAGPAGQGSTQSMANLPQGAGAAFDSSTSGPLEQASETPDDPSEAGLEAALDRAADDAASSLPAPAAGVDAAVPDPQLEAGPSGASEAGPTTGSSCDQDGDGHLAAGPPCFGDDCCDTDANVFPGQTAYFTSPNQCGGYDYDCDSVATPEYGMASCQWSAFGCSGDGFDQPTACGATAAFSVCSSSGLLTCVANVGSLTEPCR